MFNVDKLRKAIDRVRLENVRLKELFLLREIIVRRFPNFIIREKVSGISCQRATGRI